MSLSSIVCLTGPSAALFVKSCWLCRLIPSFHLRDCSVPVCQRVDAIICYPALCIKWRYRDLVHAHSIHLVAFTPQDFHFVHFLPLSPSLYFFSAFFTEYIFSLIATTSLIAKPPHSSFILPKNVLFIVVQSVVFVKIACVIHPDVFVHVFVYVVCLYIKDRAVCVRAYQLALRSIFDFQVIIVKQYIGILLLSRIFIPVYMGLFSSSFVLCMRMPAMSFPNIVNLSKDGLDMSLRILSASHVLTIFTSVRFLRFSTSG